MPSDTKHAFLTSVERSYGQRLRRFVSARLRNAAADAPDLMQEVYLRLLRIDDHEAIRNPQAYVFTVASHVLHQHALRQSATLDSVGLADAESQLPADVQTDPAAQVETEQAFEELGRSLQKLSPRRSPAPELVASCRSCGAARRYHPRLQHGLHAKVMPQLAAGARLGPGSKSNGRLSMPQTPGAETHLHPLRRSCRPSANRTPRYSNSSVTIRPANKKTKLV